MTRATVKHRPGQRPSVGLKGIPQWEAMKAVRRNLAPAAAVRECADLSASYRRRFRVTDFVLDFDKIVDALLKKKIPFVVTGVHGISTWTGRPRATHDVDILAKTGRNHARAVKAIQAIYPELDTRQLTGVTAFFVPGEKESVIDVIYPHRLDLSRTLETAIWIKDRDKRYRIPSLEAALANKYGAALTLSRDAGKRAQDMVDFYNMVRHSLDEGRASIDMAVLTELGEMIWAGGGGAEIVRFVEQAKAGEVPALKPRSAAP